MKEPDFLAPEICWNTMACLALDPFLGLISDGHGIADHLLSIMDGLFSFLDTISHTWPREYSVSAVITLGKAAASAGLLFVPYLPHAMGCLEIVVNVTSADDSFSHRAALNAMFDILLGLGEAHFMPYFPVVVKTITIGLSSASVHLRSLCYEGL